MKFILFLFLSWILFFNTKAQDTLFVGHDLNYSYDFIPDTILYSSYIYWGSSGGALALDLNADFINDIKFTQSQNSSQYNQTAELFATPLNGAKIAFATIVDFCDNGTYSRPINTPSVFSFGDTLLRSNLSFSSSTCYLSSYWNNTGQGCAFNFNGWKGLLDKYMIVSLNNDHDYVWIKLSEDNNRNLTIYKYSSSIFSNFQCLNSYSLKFKQTFSGYIESSFAHPITPIIVNGDFTDDKFNNPNAALQLYGANSYLDIPYIQNLSNTDWSFSIWFKTNTITPGLDNCLLSIADTNNFNYLYINGTDSTLSTRLGQYFYNRSTGVKIEKNIWYHAIITHTASERFTKIYINGDIKLNIYFNNISSNDNYIANPLNKNLIISSKTIDGSFYGSIDDIKFYTAQLSDTCIKEMYLSELGNYSPVIGIKEQEEEEEDVIQIYPNPNNGNFTLKSDQKILTLEIINSLGETVKKLENLNTNQVTVSNLSKGFYIIHGKTNSQLYYSKKMVVN